MIKVAMNRQVSHHPESKHPMAQGWNGRWVSFGNVTFQAAAKRFAALISTEQLLNQPLRLSLRDESEPNVLHDVIVTIEVGYHVVDTYPERNAIDYQNPTK
jgi:hypothetical protein